MRGEKEASQNAIKATAAATAETKAREEAEANEKFGGLFDEIDFSAQAD